MEERAWEGKFNVTINNVTDDWGCLSIAGPASRDILQKLTKTDFSESGFQFLHAKDIQLAGVGDVRALRISYTGILVVEMKYERSEGPSPTTRKL